MNSSPSIRPLPALLASVVALVAFLLASDATTPTMAILLYGGAVVGTACLVFWLLIPMGRRERTEQRPHLRGELAARLAESMVFVGAGYCSNVPPGVIKLMGVLPLGWTCAVLALCMQHLGVLGLSRGLDSRYSWDTHGAGRMTIVALSTVVELILRLADGGQATDGGAIKTGLELVLLGLIVDWLRCVRALTRAIPPEKD